MIERKYQLMKVRAGYYLLASNDGNTLWRISSYEEYGSLVETDRYGNDRTVKGTFWQVERFNRGGPMDVEAEDVIGERQFDAWDHYSWGLPTRNAAIQEALGAKG